MKNVEKWFEYENSKDLEKQAKYFIASTVEGYLNGCYDCGYDPMTKEQWIGYVWAAVEYEKNIITNGHETNHLKFLGKEKFNKLTSIYLDNYADVQEYIKQEEEK